MTNARLEELRAKFQENPRRYFAPFANELRKAGDPAQAISVCRAQMAGQPGHVSGHIVLGQALYEAGEAAEARDVFTAALDLDPENLIALRTLGEIAQVNGEFTTARQWYERLLDADPRNNEVTQLLKDMPTEASAAAPVVAPLADIAEEPTPFTVRQEVEEKAAVAEEAPRSTFHTSFTGSGRAYESKEPEPAPVTDVSSPEASAESSPEDSHGAFIDLEPSAHEQNDETAHVEPPVMAAAEPESLDMVDFETMPSSPVSEFTSERASPDESFESFETMPATGSPDFGAEYLVDVSQQSGAEEFGEAETIESSFAAPAEPTSFEEPEAPRAMFAERGFDGPVNDDLGWMTTPSAALSDPEAAPEDWFDTTGTEDTAPEPRAEETVQPEMGQPQLESDSWFDDVEGVSATESAEVTSDELWLPPALPTFATQDAAPAPAQAIDEPPMAAEVPSAHESFAAAVPEERPEAEAPNEVNAAAWTAPDEAPATAELPDVQSEPAWMASGETAAPFEAGVEAEAVEPPPTAEQVAEPAVAETFGFDVHAVADAADEAFIVEHPVEASSVPTHDAAPQNSWEPELPVEAMGVEDIGVIHAISDVSAEAANAGAGIGHAPETVEAEASVPPAPFITETLAELYLQQGFRDEALSIFNQLVVREPENQALKDRIAAIEKGEGTPASQPSEIPLEERASSQSVRTFFSRLARRPAVPSSQEPPAGLSQSATPDVPFAAAASALANLFSASKPPAPDEGAASTLAGAFTDPSGRPSRAADRELSLDHLFRDVAPGGSPTGGVTLDEFYSTPNVAQGSPTEPGETGSDEPGGADIRQFTAWLEGLRKK